MDSVSVKTTFRETLAESGIIFCSFSDAVREYPDLVRRYMGTVVPYTDNFFASLNSAVFSDGSFCYIPKGVRYPPMELSTYFRINAENTASLNAPFSSLMRKLMSATWKDAPHREEMRTSFMPPLLRLLPKTMLK